MKNYILPIAFLIVALFFGGYYFYQADYIDVARITEGIGKGQDIKSITSEAPIGDRDAKSEIQNNISIDSDTFVAALDSVVKRNKNISANNLDFINQLKMRYGYSGSINPVYGVSNGNIIYFSELAYDPLRTVVYSFDLDSGDHSKIYEYQRGDEWMSLIGIQDTKLIFFKTRGDDSPGYCFNEWVNGYLTQTGLEHQGYQRGIVSLDLTNTNTGLTKFLVSKEKFDVENTEYLACLKEENLE